MVEETMAQRINLGVALRLNGSRVGMINRGNVRRKIIKKLMLK